MADCRSPRPKAESTPLRRLPNSSDARNRASEDRYRQRWKWDRVYWGGHQVDCWPGNCPMRVYVRDGKVAWLEQAGGFPQVERGIPDFSPMGCQKGCAWQETLYGPERVLYPLKRAGERGDGNWQRVSWDQALTEIADAVIDAIQEVGPESIFCPTGCNGMAWGFTSRNRFLSLVGGLTSDILPDMNDFPTGLQITFGTFLPCPSEDDCCHSELILIYNQNPVYTRIPYYHFVAEARYKGAEVVLLAPDFSPSAIHADHHVALKPGSDAAFFLGMCKVIIDEGVYNAPFVKEQTDLPLLVRLDNRRFLRASDIRDGGREDQFYFWDGRAQQMVEAPRGTLALGQVDPALEGTYHVRLTDEREIEVAPAFQLLKERLRDYEPERASQACEVHPEVIRTLARKVAQKRTQVAEGYGANKYYHGDLMDRAMCLLLGLTGNWGKKGTGVRYGAIAAVGGLGMFLVKPGRGPEETERLLALQQQLLGAVKAEDPTMTDEIAGHELLCRLVRMPQVGAMGRMNVSVPPVFFWYRHCGFREVWNRRDWNDPAMARSFDEYMQEALDKGWWQGVDQPPEDRPPRVFFEVGGNILRRARGGQSMFLRHLWPKLKMIVTVDWRMSATALFSDFVLPSASQHEKLGFGIGSVHSMNLVFHDKAVDPPGEALHEWQIFRLLARKLEERAGARGFLEYQDTRGRTFRLENLEAAYTADGNFEDEETIVRENVQDAALEGAIPEGTSLETFRQQGFMRFNDWGRSFAVPHQASDVKPDETHNPFRWHTEDKLPYPTLTRRAQYYIDHEWFLEAGEEMPVHKEPPKMGGDYPFVLTGGHNRWSIHSLNITNRLMLQTNRGQPHLMMNNDDASARGIRDNDEVRVFNDMGSFIVRVKISSAVRPGQLIMYNGWDAYQFRGCRAPADVMGGMVKYLQLAGGYGHGHIAYRPQGWQPVHVDRCTRVDVAGIAPADRVKGQARVPRR